MHNKFHFTFDNIKKQYKKAIDCGYKIITCINIFFSWLQFWLFCYYL